MIGDEASLNSNLLLYIPILTVVSTFSRIKLTQMGHFTDFMRKNPNRILGSILYLSRLFAISSRFFILLSAAPSQPCRYGWALRGGGVRGSEGGEGDCSIGRKCLPFRSLIPHQGVDLHGLRGSRGRPTRSQGVKEWAYRVSGGQGVGLQDPLRSRGRPTGSQGVKGEG